MRVLMICPELPTADCPGSMAPTARQIQSLRDLGIDTQIVDMRGMAKLKYLQVIPRIRRLAKHVDLIHAHFGYCGWLARLAPIGAARQPIVMSFMGDDLLGTPYSAAGDLEWFSQWMVSANIRLARSMDRVIVKSREMADVLAPTPCTIIPNGVDVEAFRPMDRTAAKNEVGLALEQKCVLFPGDPENPRKGHHLALESIAVAEQDLGQPIRLLPLWGVDPSRVALTMNACEAMLMTSLIEGSPNVVKEALACNVPIVGVSVGDVREQLTGVAGCSICPRDPIAIGRQLARTLQTPTCEGRQAILKRKLDLESVAHRVVAEYRHALGRQDVQHACTVPTGGTQPLAGTLPQRRTR